MNMTSLLLSAPPSPALITARAGAEHCLDFDTDIAARVIAHQVLRRVTADPFFVGYALAVVAKQDGLDLDGLAHRLGCSIACLPRLALYPRPEPITNRFGEQVMRMADRTGAGPVALTAVLLEV